MPGALRKTMQQFLQLSTMTDERDPLALIDNVRDEVEDPQLAMTLDELSATLKSLTTRMETLDTELEETQKGTLELTTELEKALGRFETLFETVTVGIYLTDDEFGQYITVNQAFIELLGYEDRNELMAAVDSIRDDVFVDDTQYETLHSAIEAKGDVTDFEYQIKTKSGDTRWVTDHVVSIDDEWGPDGGFQGGVIDTTKRREYEQQVQEQRDTLRILNQVVRHDIRNHLQVIKGYVEMLEGVDETYFEHIETSVGNALELTKTARDISKTILDKGADLVPIRLHRTITAQVRDVREGFSDATVTIDGDLPDIWVEADDMLGSVFQNLLQNAITHNDHDEPQVFVSAHQHGGTVRVEVADNGPGVPDKQKETIFGEGEKGLESEGTGVGLYLVETLVDRYDGEVWVEDNEPRGSIFVVELPVMDR